MSDKDFKVKNKLQVKGITSAGPVVSDASGNLDSTAYVATQYGGTGTSTSPSSGQILYSSSGTTYAPTTLTSLVTPVTYSENAPSSPVVGQIWVESDSSSDSFDPNIIRRQAFTATAGQTVFTTTQTFIDGYEQVFFNGLLLLRTTDYTTSNSNTITLGVAAAVNDIVEVVTVTNLNSVNTYTQGEIDTALSAKLSTSTAASTYLTQSNASSTYLTSSTAASTYLSQSNAATTYVPQTSYSVAGKNKIINGDFGVWQRGINLALNSSYTYLADRFKTTGRNGSGTQSQHSLTVADSALCANLKYAYKLTMTSAATNVTPTISQVIEDSFPYYGKTMTLSFYAKASKAITLQSAPDLIWANADNQPSTVSHSLTTIFQRFTHTFTITPSGSYNSSTDYGLIIPFYAPMNDTYDIYITGVQVEAGSVATSFTTATGNPASELAACQRYYWRNSGAVYNPMGPMGYTTASTTANGYMILPVTMRATPTSVDFANLTWRQINALGYTVTGITLSSVSTNKVIRADVAVSGGGMTSNIWGFLETDGYLNGVFGISAEL